MEEKHVDARGLACPQPVVLTRNAMLESGVGIVRVVVDSDVAAENVQRMAKTQGWHVAAEQAGSEIRMTVRRGEAEPTIAARQSSTSGRLPAESPRVVVLLTSDLFGSGDAELGKILMRAFIKTLKDLDPLPGKIIFANAGVRLTTEGSDLIDDLRALEADGVEILSCGTCLDYYKLLDSLQVGVKTNMYEIASSLVEADRLLRP